MNPTSYLKRRFHFHVAMHVICPWSFTSLTSFSCFFKPIRISWSTFYQLHVLMLTLRTYDIMIIGGMNGKLASENFFWKWFSRGKRKWWNDCSKLSLSRLKNIGDIDCGCLIWRDICYMFYFILWFSWNVLAKSILCTNGK